MEVISSLVPTLPYFEGKSKSQGQRKQRHQPTAQVFAAKLRQRLRLAHALTAFLSQYSTADLKSKSCRDRLPVDKSGKQEYNILNKIKLRNQTKLLVPDTSGLDGGLRKALQSPLFISLRSGDILMDEHEGGCVLFQKREQVAALLNKEDEYGQK